MREDLDQETVQITRPRLFFSDRQGHEAYYIRTEDSPIATQADDQVARMARLAMRIANQRLPNTARVAHIGGGFCVLPRILDLRRWGTQDIYEIEQRIVDKALERWPNRPWTFIVGDWHATLTGLYDVIVYDLGELSDNDRDLLNQHLAPGGMLLGGE